MKKLHNKPKSSIKLFHTNKFRGKEEKVFCRKRLSPTNKTPNDAEKKSREFTWLFSLLFMNILYELERISPNYAFFSGNLILIILISKVICYFFNRDFQYSGYLFDRHELCHRADIFFAFFFPAFFPAFFHFLISILFNSPFLVE